MSFSFPQFQGHPKFFPVIIVGAGPAGISTWLHLNKQFPGLSHETLVIDKSKFPREKLCAGGLGAWSEDVLRYLGIQLDIPFLSIEKVQFRLGKDQKTVHHPNFFKIVQRIDFDNAMVHTALKRGLAIRENESFIDVGREDNKLLVKTNKQIYCANVVVGADGALSRVASKSISHRINHLAPTIQTISSESPLSNELFSERKIVLNLEPIKEGLQGYLWHVPCLRDNVPSIVHGIADFRVCHDRPRAHLKSVFSRELRAQNLPQHPNLWRSHPMRWLSSGDIISQPNILLVGDAAGIEPAFGGGIHISFSYGDVAARAIADAFQNDDFSFRDYGERLQSHFIGKYISRCIRLSKDMYEGKTNPLSSAYEFFTQKVDNHNLLSLLLSGS